MIDREKTFVNLHKQFLKLHYKVAEYEMTGVEPPDKILKKIKNVERQLRIASKALE